MRWDEMGTEGEEWQENEAKPACAVTQRRSQPQQHLKEIVRGTRPNKSRKADSLGRGHAGEDARKHVQRVLVQEEILARAAAAGKQTGTTCMGEPGASVCGREALRTMAAATAVRRK
jgi:hypothetical protein